MTPPHADFCFHSKSALGKLTDCSSGIDEPSARSALRLDLLSIANVICTAEPVELMK